MIRLYFKDSIPDHGQCNLPREQAHHLVHVLRARLGDAIVLFDGKGNEFPATIASISKAGTTLTIGEARAVNRESKLSITLAQGISSGERMDYTIQKAVELGVSMIQPLAMERSVVRLSAERAARRVAHWQGIAIAACEQCGRNQVPLVTPVRSLRDWLGSGMTSGSMCIVLAAEGRDTLRTLTWSGQPVALVAGPEGGLAPAEHDDVARSGFSSLRLGPRVLRTETAAIAALAAMQALWGDF